MPPKPVPRKSNSRKLTVMDSAIPMVKPPITAPTTESSPPRITAGNARKAKKAVAVSTPAERRGNSETNNPATAASTAPIAQAIEKIRPTLMPWARAASWSNAVARIAMPVRVRKK